MIKRKRKVQHDYDYINNYNRTNYDRITLIVPKGVRDLIKALAEQEGESVNEYIINTLPPALVAEIKQMSELAKLKKYEEE